MTDYLADTHSLIWHFARPQQLGPQARTAFAAVNSGAARLYVPVIVLAELIFAVEGGRVSSDIETMVTQLSAIPNVEIVPLTSARVLELTNLTGIPEMHDRIIVAEAIALGASLVTRDQAITASGLVPVVW
jgi:PIN domain nuclease of toxin-antitoxin system